MMQNEMEVGGAYRESWGFAIVLLIGREWRDRKESGNSHILEVISSSLLRVCSPSNHEPKDVGSIKRCSKGLCLPGHARTAEAWRFVRRRGKSLRFH